MGLAGSHRDSRTGTRGQGLADRGSPKGLAQAAVRCRRDESRSLRAGSCGDEFA